MTEYGTFDVSSSLLGCEMKLENPRSRKYHITQSHFCDHWHSEEKQTLKPSSYIHSFVVCFKSQNYSRQFFIFVVNSSLIYCNKSDSIGNMFTSPYQFKFILVVDYKTYLTDIRTEAYPKRNLFSFNQILDKIFIFSQHNSTPHVPLTIFCGKNYPNL